MANEKKKLSEEQRQSVAGGDVYAGRNANGEMVYYVPHPNPRTRASISYSDERAAQAEAKRLKLDDTVQYCSDARAAKRASDLELGRLIRGKTQTAIDSFFSRA